MGDFLLCILTLSQRFTAAKLLGLNTKGKGFHKYTDFRLSH